MTFRRKVRAGIPCGEWSWVALALAVLGIQFLASRIGYANTPPAAARTPGLPSKIASLTAKLRAKDTPAFRYRRWTIIQLCHQLPRPLPVPAEAEAQAARGVYLFESAKSRSGVSDYEKSAAAFRQASLIAPCKPEYYYNRADALQYAVSAGGASEDAAGAAMSLHWFLEAVPHSPLRHLAIRNIGKLEAQAGISSDAQLGWVPLIWAAGWNDNPTATHMVRHLLAQGVDVNATADVVAWKGISALQNAALSQDNLPIVKALVAAGADVLATVHSAPRHSADTALHLAARNGFDDIVRFLIGHGANVNARDKRGATPLFWAAVADHAAAVRYLVSHGADINAVAKGDEGQTPLIEAAWHGDADLVKYLIAAGANVDDVDSPGDTALEVAVANGDKDLAVVSLLVSAGAKLNTVDKQHYTPLEWAVDHRDLNMVRILVVHGADVNNGGGTIPPLTLAAEMENFDVVRYLVKAHANVDPQNAMPPLLGAIVGNGDKADKAQIVQYLLRHGANVNGADNLNNKPLCVVVRRGDSKIASLLLSAGADVNAVSGSLGCVPLVDAARVGDLDMVQLLVKHAAKVNGKDSKGATALFWAAANDHVDVARYLIKHGAEVNVSAAGDDGDSALMMATIRGNTGMVQYLISAGAKVNGRNRFGGTPLQWAAGLGYVDVAQYLISAGAKVDGKDRGGRTPLYYAALTDKIDAARYLIEHGAEVNVSERDGNAPLMVAANNGHTDMVAYLISAGADINAMDKVGETALCEAAYTGHLATVKYLVSAGAGVNVKKKNRGSALDCAINSKDKNKEAVETFLEEHGATE